VTKFALLSTAFVAMLVALLSAAPAQAFNSVSFVSSTGTSTICTRAAPCGTFQAAHDVTLSEGEIHCLDSGPFGPPGSVTTISIPITIDCADTGAVGSAFVINGTGIVVKIRNLSINDEITFGSIGINFQNGAALFVENCVIQNYSHSFPSNVGISFQPTAPGARLVVTDTIINNNGDPLRSTGGGIVINPQSGGSARVVLNRVSIDNNIFGIVADGTGSTGGINMTIADSVTSGNSQDGIVAATPSGGAPIGVYVKNTKSANNGFGIRSIGSNVTVRVDGSSVIGNGTGLTALSGGALLSAGNNMVQANGSNGAFSGSVGLQ
jgi:hypothetical protein